MKLFKRPFVRTTFLLMSSALILSCSQGSESAVPEYISVSSLPASTAYEDKYNGVDPSKGEASQFYSTDTTSPSSSNYSISISAKTPLFSPSDSSALKDELKTFVKVEKANANEKLGSPALDSTFNAKDRTITKSYVYCYFNAKIIPTGTKISYNQIGAVWALEGNDTWYGTQKWYTIKGYRSGDGAFHAEQPEKDIKTACENTIRKKYSSSTTSNVPTDAELLYYTESTSKIDYERPIWASDVKPKTKFTRLVAFGDSLSDIGNDKSSTLGLLPNVPYWGGRFSSGLNWTDYVSIYLGVASYNWAYGGSETDNPVAGGIVMPMSAQVDNYINKKGVSTLGFIYGGYGNFENTLFSVWSGANNYFNYTGFIPDYYPPTSPAAGTLIHFSQEIPKAVGYFTFKNSKRDAKGNITETIIENDDAFINTTVGEIRASIESLIGIGAKYIVVPNLPQLADIPAESPKNLALAYGVNLETGLAMNKRLHNLVVTHNLRLAEMIEDVRANNQKVTFITLDINLALNKMLFNPHFYLSEGTLGSNPVSTPFTQKNQLQHVNNYLTDKNKLVGTNVVLDSKFPTPCYNNLMKISDINPAVGFAANLMGFGGTYTGNYYLINEKTKKAEDNLLCSDPENHVFFDTVHPTTQVHAILGYALSQAIKEN